jgi:hypothetical protein
MVIYHRAEKIIPQASIPSFDPMNAAFRRIGKWRTPGGMQGTADVSKLQKKPPL